MSRQVVSRRVLAATAAVAGVLGVTGGVTAARLLDTDGTSDAASPDASPDAGPDASPDARPDPTPGQVLWADKAALHDGDTTVPLDLVDPPTAVFRIDGGWLLVVEIARGLGEYQVSVVRPDGSLPSLAQTRGVGDVSGDGTRYLAATESGYDVWDLATMEVVETVPGGRVPDQAPTGGARFVDDDTVATAWSTSLDGLPEVLVSDLGSEVRRVLADDVVGEWGISPDGRWFVGSLAKDVGDGTYVAGCPVVRPVAGGPGTQDCGGTVDGTPSFAADSSAVLSDPGGRRSDGPGGFRLLPLGGAAEQDPISAPTGPVRAVVVGVDQVAVVPSRAFSLTSVVLLCSASVPCQEVGRSDGSPREIVLGR